MENNYILSGYNTIARLTFLPTLSTSKSTSARSLIVRLKFCKIWYGKMKIKNSLKSLKGRHRANRIVRRRGRVYVINKENPRFKARQG